MPKTFNYEQFAAMLDDLSDLITWHVKNDRITGDGVDSDVAARLVERRWAEPDEAAEVTQQFWNWLEA